MVGEGLRERKKAHTRRHIAETAARLFGERGYEQVAVADVARAAQVAEQTVYNYFRGKEQLVTDRDQEIQERLTELILTRPSGVSPAAAIREFVMGSVAATRDIPPEIWRGELAYLAAISPTVHRLALEMLDRQSAAIADAIVRSSDVSPARARMHGIAISGVLQIFLSEAGAKTRDGQSQAAIVDELFPMMESILDELDRWFTASGLYA